VVPKRRNWITRHRGAKTTSPLAWSQLVDVDCMPQQLGRFMTSSSGRQLPKQVEKALAEELRVSGVTTSGCVSGV
jgi:hypothetical protein